MVRVCDANPADGDRLADMDMAETLQADNLRGFLCPNASKASILV
jgi:hypothetical protein